MRKTLLQISLLGFVAAALLLASCDTALSDPTYAKIGGIENLKVTPYTGVNLVTWDPVTDATAYTVYRKEKPKDKDWGSYVQVTSSATTNRYSDIIGNSNILSDSTEYTYKVIASSGTSNLPDVGNSAAEVSYKTDAAKFPAATPQFPARGTALGVTITGAAITVDNVYGKATLTWTGSDNPAISYTLQKTQPVDWDEYSGNNYWSRSGTTATANIAYAGYVDARIYATFNGGTYYPASAAVYVEPVAYNVQHLDSISATLQTNPPVSGKTVTLTYSKVPGATA
jgi:hypothetical protein